MGIRLDIEMTNGVPTYAESAPASFKPGDYPMEDAPAPRRNLDMSTSSINNSGSLSSAEGQFGTGMGKGAGKGGKWKGGKFKGKTIKFKGKGVAHSHRIWQIGACASCVVLGDGGTEVTTRTCTMYLIGMHVASYKTRRRRRP